MTSAEVEHILYYLKNDTLQPGDIVLSMSVNDVVYDIDLQMNCKFPFWSDRLNFQSILDELSIGDRVMLFFCMEEGLNCSDSCHKKIELKLNPEILTNTERCTAMWKIFLFFPCVVKRYFATR